MQKISKGSRASQKPRNLYKSQNEIKGTSPKLFLPGKGIVDYIIWIGFGGAALGAIFVSLLGFVVSLHPPANTEKGDLLYACANLLVLILFSWYYSYHHSLENTFHDTHQKRIKNKRINPSLYAAFVIASCARFIIMDSYSYVTGKELLFPLLPYHAIFSLILIVWVVARVILLIRGRTSEQVAFELPSIKEIDSKRFAMRKLSSLTETERKELAILLYEQETFRNTTFKIILGVIWRAVGIAFILQFLQSFVGGL